MACLDVEGTGLMLQSIKMVALMPLCGDYGRPTTGDVFETNEEVAESLEARGMACRYLPPRNVVAPPKMTAPAANKMLPPFVNKSR